jgi:hypothetical protein
MEQAQEVQKKKMSLEARIGLIAFHSMAAVYICPTSLDAFSNGDYVVGTWLAVAGLGTLFVAAYHSKKTIQDYKK